MRIEIDTKEDLHNLRHVIQFLSAISANAGKNKHFDDSSYNSSSASSSVMSMFSDSSPSQQTPPATSASMFNMFGDSTPSTSSSAPSSTSSDNGFMSLFSSPQETPKDDDNKDFIDSLKVY